MAFEDTPPKRAALKLVERLPEGALWEDVLYAVYVCTKIDRGLKAAAEGRVVSQEEVERRFGLT
jgi:predicted transcriptional regulator